MCRENKFLNLHGYDAMVKYEVYNMEDGEFKPIL